MIARPLMTPDELKSMQKGQFVIMKTGRNPIRATLRLFTKWGITFDKQYELEDRGARAVHYVNRFGMEREVKRAYRKKEAIFMEEVDADGYDSDSGQEIMENTMSREEKKHIKI